MTIDSGSTLDRRELLTRAAPACVGAWLGICRMPGLAEWHDDAARQEQHKFDVPSELKLSTRQRVGMQNGNLIEFIKTLQNHMPEEEVIGLLNSYSAEVGKRAGEQQARGAPDTSFQRFVATFRPPRYANSLTHEVVEDSEKVFELRVTECIWAETFRNAGLGGEIGHAAVCNMDYYWPSAFNPSFKMERTKTLMQGDDHCNHRYLDTA